MRVNKWKLHSYITVILLIANSPLMWKCFVNIPDFIMKALLLVWCISALVMAGKISINGRYSKVMLWIIVYLTIYIIGSHYDVGGSILNILLTSLVFFAYSHVLLKKRKFNILVDAYVNLFCIIGGISLFFWLFGSVFDVLPFARTMYYHWGNETNLTKTYFWLYFENAVQNQNLLGLTIPRNCGIFPEVPGYCDFLLIAFGGTLLGNRKIDKEKFFLLLSTLLSTQSTKAIVTLVIVFIAKFMLDNKGVKSTRIRLLRYLFSGILIAIGAFVIYAVLLDKSGTASYIVRMDDMNAAIKTWRTNKIFGTGYENDLSIIANITTSWLRNNIGLSMGMAVLLAEGGIVLTLYYVIAFIAGIKSINTKSERDRYLLFSLLLFLNLLASNCAFTMIMILLVNTGYALLSVNNKAFRPTRGVEIKRGIAGKYKEESRV